MSELWSVTFNRVSLVSRFDAAGKKIEDKVIKVPITMNDLPYVTAKMYHDKVPAGEATLVQQFNSFNSAVDHSKFGKVPGRKATSYKSAPITATAKEVASSVKAAMSADFAAAITAESKAS